MHLYRLENGQGLTCSRSCKNLLWHKKNTVWNKGKSKENNTTLKQLGEKSSKTKKEKYSSGDTIVWNKGLTKETDERVLNAVLSQTKTRNTEGERKEAWKRAMSKGQVKAHAAGHYPLKFTKPEKETWSYLESIGYTVKEFKDKFDSDPFGTWYHQYNCDDTFVPDFACPGLKYIIEVHGCAIHGHDLTKCNHSQAKYGWYKVAQTNLIRDKKKFNFYDRKGWKWAIVWECECNKGDFHRLHKYLLLPNHVDFARNILKNGEID